MKMRIMLVALSSMCLVITSYGQQRVEFQRQKFDRSRFQNAGPTADQEPASAQQPRTATPASAPVTTPPPPAPPSFRDDSTERAPTPSKDDRATAQSAKEAEKAALEALIANPKLDEIPDKWFKNAKHYEELVEIQKQTGACLLVYFKRPHGESDEKGRVNWFEKKIFPDIKWRKAMRNYIKLEIFLPSNPQAEELAKKYQVKSTPALYVHKLNSMPGRVPIFSYDQRTRDLDLYELKEILGFLRDRSGPAYENLF